MTREDNCYDNCSKHPSFRLAPLKVRRNNLGPNILGPTSRSTNMHIKMIKERTTWHQTSLSPCIEQTTVFVIQEKPFLFYFFILLVWKSLLKTNRNTPVTIFVEFRHSSLHITLMLQRNTSDSNNLRAYLNWLKKKLLLVYFVWKLVLSVFE